MPHEIKLPKETLDAIRDGKLGNKITKPEDIHRETKKERLTRLKRLRN